jgi:cytochrome oxidase Cu insertion factor (SCO1/SenC/PrrC family)
MMIRPRTLLMGLLPLASLLLMLGLPWLPQGGQRLIDFPWLDQQQPYHDDWWVFFGYVGCPDVCPDTLAKLHNAYRRLPAHLQPGVLLIDATGTADPAVVRQYAQAFHPDFQAYAPSPAELQRLSRLFGVKITPRPDGRGVDHSSAVYQLHHTESGWQLIRTFQDRRLGPDDLVKALLSR